jgi:hypothetical protein
MLGKTTLMASSNIVLLMPTQISEVVHLAVAPPDVLLLYINLVGGHSHNISNDHRPSAQEFMAGQ